MADLDDERADLNALIREAHEAIKDLNRASREADKKYERLTQVTENFERTMDDFEAKVRLVARNKVDDVIDDLMAGRVDEFIDEITRKVAEVQDAIYLRFDAMAEELTQGIGQSAWNNMSLPDYLQSQREGT